MYGLSTILVVRAVQAHGLEVIDGRLDGSRIVCASP